MIAKLVLGCMTLFLYAVAASASLAVASEPKLTYPTGTLLETENKIRAASVGEPSLTSVGGNITCSSAALTGNLKKNSGSAIEATIESVSFNSGGNCAGDHALIDTSVSENGIPWCFRSTPELKADEFQIRGNSCDKEGRPIRLVVTKTVPTRECVYESLEPIIGTYPTDPSEAILGSANTPFERVEGEVICPTDLELDSSYTFETTGGSPLYIATGPSLTGLSSGTEVRGRGSVVFTIGVSVTCSSELTGTLKKNTGGAIEIEIEDASVYGASTLNTCAWPIVGNQKFTFDGATNGLPWCLRATSGLGADEFQITGNGCASESRPIRFIADTYQTIECVYQRQAALAGTYTTHPKDAVLTFENAVFLKVGTQSGCPAQTQLDSSMTLERDIEGTQPLYIS